MGIKKVISLLFLLLANVVILAHSVVFHHHDNPIPVTLCVADQEHHCDENAEQNHCCHDTESAGNCCDSKSCLLNTPFTTNDNIRALSAVNNFDFVIIHLFSVNQIVQITDLTGLPFRQKPYSLPFYSEFISQSKGLRAPPVC